MFMPYPTILTTFNCDWNYTVVGWWLGILCGTNEEIMLVCIWVELFTEDLWPRISTILDEMVKMWNDRRKYGIWM